MSGRIKKFATVEPSRVNLEGVVGETVSRTVTIVPETEEPFQIMAVNAMKGLDFTHELKETKVNGKKAYSLIVTNTRKTEGRYYDKLIVLTDRSDHQPITIIVIGDVKKPGGANPAAAPQAPGEAPVVPGAPQAQPVQAPAPQ